MKFKKTNIAETVYSPKINITLRLLLIAEKYSVHLKVFDVYKV